MARRHERTRARRAALQVLYSAELTEEAPADIAAGRGLIDEIDTMSDYALRLVRGVEERGEDVDARLDAASDNWSLLRMPVVDRCILRLATYEMAYVKEVPLSVSINEAVELAKDFGGEDESPRFVNGVLGRIAKTLEEPAAEGAEGAAAVDELAAEVAGAEDAAEPATAVEEPAAAEAEPAVEESAEAVDAEPAVEDGADA